MAVTVENGLGTASATAGNRVDQVGHRRAQAFFVQNTAGVAVPGVLGANPLTGYASQMKYKIAATGFVLTRSPDTGAVILPIPSAIDVPTTAAPTANPRIDIIYVKQPLEELSESGKAFIEVANGTPAASPTPPTLPAGALEIGRHLVKVGDAGTATAEGFTNLAADVSLQTLITVLQSRTTTVEGRATALEAAVTALTARVAALEALPRAYVQTTEPAGARNLDFWINT
jgi:hypothetical protein